MALAALGEPKYMKEFEQMIKFTSERDNTELPGKKASIEELKIFINEAIADSKVVNSKIFLLKAFLFLSGQEDVLAEQKRCLYP